MMDSELKAKWVAALRSDQYPQAVKVLRSPSGGYCCLGVLCDLVDPQGWAEKPGRSMSGRDGYSHKGTYTFPSIATLQQVFGETAPGPVHEYLSTLAGKNDNGATFAQIAALIEESELL